MVTVRTVAARRGERNDAYKDAGTRRGDGGDHRQPNLAFDPGKRSACRL